MATATVASLTEAAINTAVSAAGVGGTVIFPAGLYTVADLKVSVANQTWQMERGVIIKRSNTTTSSLIVVEADGWRLRGGQLDANRAGNPHNAVGVSSTGFSVDMRDFDLVGASHWGISVSDAPLILRDGSIRKTGQAGVFWRIMAGSPSTNGPDIDRINISRSDPADYIGAGGIHIQSQTGDIKVAGTCIQNCRITLPQGSLYSAVGIELLWVERGLVFGNEIIGGRISISFGGTRWSQILGNSLKYATSYHVEMGGASDNIITGNTIQGIPGVGQAFEVSVRGHRNKFIANSIISVKRPIRISADCNNTIFRD
jgi:hypothetical protein